MPGGLAAIHTSVSFHRASLLSNEVEAFVGGLTEKPTLTRNGKDLSEQFDYRYSVADDFSASGYFIKFRQSLFAAGVVLSKPAIDTAALDRQP
jgi:hypothetical protein